MKMSNKLNEIFTKAFTAIAPLLSQMRETNKRDSGTLKAKLSEVSSKFGIQASYNSLLRSEVVMGLRKPSLAIFDHTWHMIGGGQKYGFTIAEALKDLFDITLIANRNLTHKNIADWYHLDLSSCQIKIIPISYFDQFSTIHLDPARINNRTPNYFHVISRESGNYDFFINNSMNEKVLPLANKSSLICHFPERRPKDYFYADQYTHIIFNSQYTAHWIRKKWKLEPHKHIYPPVDMAPLKTKPNQMCKENIIFSVARFEEGGSKKQLEMVNTFIKLNLHFPELMKDWLLVLAGGSGDPENNNYLNSIKDRIQKSGFKNIRLVVNCPGDELKNLYYKARIFWHLCGLDQRDQALVEHFGMTIVEAMQNACVPIVYDGGGQQEIVMQGESGFRVSTTADLMSYTLKVIRDEGLQEKLGWQAQQRSFLFSRDVFKKTVQDFFIAELEKYKSIS